MMWRLPSLFAAAAHFFHYFLPATQVAWDLDRPVEVSACYPVSSTFAVL